MKFLGKVKIAIHTLSRGGSKSSTFLLLEQTDPYARFIGAKSPELRTTTQSPISKERKHFLRQIFQYAVRREVMRRRATNPSSDPWDSFFYNAYSLTKPTRYEPVNQRQQMSLKTSVRRKLSTTPTPTPILGGTCSSRLTVIHPLFVSLLDHECQVVEGSNTDASSSLSSTSNIVVHDETVFQVFSSFALHSLTNDDKVESGAVRVSATTSPSPGRSPPGLRPPTPPSSGGGVRRLSRSRERRLHIQLQSRDVGHDGQVVETIEIVHYGGNDRLKA